MALTIVYTPIPYTPIIMTVIRYDATKSICQTEVRQENKHTIGKMLFFIAVLLEQKGARYKLQYVLNNNHCTPD